MIICIVSQFRITEIIIPTCVKVLLSNMPAQYLSGNIFARGIYFAELFSIFFHLCDFVSPLFRNLLQHNLETPPLEKSDSWPLLGGADLI